ncbi:MAG: sigma-70 family RNA polymerase sigma factor [Armatimonadetes bacterium]|nr:sigma-70 family RNA polymerase sigma factor [Armatimonadota bacterium]
MLIDEVWEPNRDYVRRILLALTRDVDLAEDCLQDTYLRARAGISGFKGGSEKAWLAAIAKNVFYSRARRKSYGSELSLNAAPESCDDSVLVGSSDHLTFLIVREAVARLAPDVRRALVMKHYGGWDYSEIARQLGCSPTMAKHRVWRAMRKLRETISAMEEVGLECQALRGATVVGWLYGTLPERKRLEVKSHVKLCSSCRKRLAEFRKLGGVLDLLEGEFCIHTLIDIDENGRTPRYVWVKYVNSLDHDRRIWGWKRRHGWDIESLILQGEQVEIHWTGREKEPGFEVFQGELPEPVPPGGLVSAMFVSTPPEGSEWDSKCVGDGVWHYHHRHSPNPTHEILFVICHPQIRVAHFQLLDPFAFECDRDVLVGAGAGGIEDDALAEGLMNYLLAGAVGGHARRALGLEVRPPGGFG